MPHILYDWIRDYKIWFSDELKFYLEGNLTVQGKRSFAVDFLKVELITLTHNFIPPVRHKFTARTLNPICI